MNAWLCDACGAIHRGEHPTGWLIVDQAVPAESDGFFKRWRQQVAVFCSDACCAAWAGTRSAVGR